MSKIDEEINSKVRFYTNLLILYLTFDPIHLGWATVNTCISHYISKRSLYQTKENNVNRKQDKY